MKYDKLAKTLLASASLAALLAATPFSFDYDSKDGISMKISQAFADENEGEDGDSGGGDDGDSDDGDSDDGDDGDSDDGDDEDSDDDESDDDESDDDGDNEDSDDDGSDDDGTADNGGDNDSNEFVLADGTRVEISADGLNIELHYVDGSAEEIQNGVYEKKDASGTTIEERPATAEDVERLQAIING